MDLMDVEETVWPAFKWLSTGTSGGLLWTRQWTFGFLKSRNFL